MQDLSTTNNTANSLSVDVSLFVHTVAPKRYTVLQAYLANQNNPNNKNNPNYKEHDWILRVLQLIAFRRGYEWSHYNYQFNEYPDNDHCSYSYPKASTQYLTYVKSKKLLKWDNLSYINVPHLQPNLISITYLLSNPDILCP